jgi:acetyl esterase/lipase
MQKDVSDRYFFGKIKQSGSYRYFLQTPYFVACTSAISPLWNGAQVALTASAYIRNPILFMNVHCLIAGLLFIGMGSFCQTGTRYKDQVFSKTIMTKNLFYGAENLKKNSSFMMDIYEPEEDTVSARPVIIWLHGGGFKFGSKRLNRMRIWSKEFARRGYVCIPINYRLSKKKPLKKFEDLAEGCIEGMEDVERAVAYMQKRATELRLDTTKIILAGHSAGAMIAIQQSYTSKQQIRSLISGQPGSSGNVNKNQFRGAAIINFWGAIYDTSWLKNAKVPIVSVHGTGDRVVPYNFGDKPLFGSAAIHRSANVLEIPNSLKSYKGMGHELQKYFNPLYAGPVVRKRWREAADFAALFLFEHVF